MENIPAGLMEGIIEKMGGRNPLDEANARMDEMSREELRTLVYIAANGIAKVIMQDESDPEEALLLFLKGVAFIFDTYDNATIEAETNTKFAGTA